MSARLARVLEIGMQRNEERTIGAPLTDTTIEERLRSIEERLYRLESGEVKASGATVIGVSMINTTTRFNEFRKGVADALKIDKKMFKDVSGHVSEESKVDALLVVMMKAGRIADEVLALDWKAFNKLVKPGGKKVMVLLSSNAEIEPLFLDYGAPVDAVVGLSIDAYDLIRPLRGSDETKRNIQGYAVLKSNLEGWDII